MYFINATLNFAFSLFKILRLCTLLKIMMPKQNVFFLNKIGWHLVYEYDTYSLYRSCISVNFYANWTGMKKPITHVSQMFFKHTRNCI